MYTRTLLLDPFVHEPQKGDHIIYHLTQFSSEIERGAINTFPGIIGMNYNKTPLVSLTYSCSSCIVTLYVKQ